MEELGSDGLQAAAPLDELPDSSPVPGSFGAGSFQAACQDGFY